MPHIIVKMYPGKSAEQKKQLAAEIVKDFEQLFGYGEESLSVGIEDVDPARWAQEIYQKEIIDKSATLYKKPGYNPFK